MTESFDLHPKNDSSRFSVSSWVWKALLWVIESSAALAGLAIDFDYWDSNDNRGLGTQAECDELADAIEKFIRGRSDDFVFHRPFSEGEKQSIVLMLINSTGSTQADAEDFVRRETKHYVVDVATIREFIAFLRQCGGFEIG